EVPHAAPVHPESILCDARVKIAPDQIGARGPGWMQLEPGLAAGQWIQVTPVFRAAIDHQSAVTLRRRWSEHAPALKDTRVNDDGFERRRSPLRLERARHGLVFEQDLARAHDEHERDGRLSHAVDEPTNEPGRRAWLC